MTNFSDLARVQAGCPVPWMRLEEEYPEESKIHDVEAEIDSASQRGEPTDSLIQERQEILESWRERVQNELARKSKDAELLRERDRVLGYFNERVKLASLAPAN